MDIDTKRHCTCDSLTLDMVADITTFQRLPKLRIKGMICPVNRIVSTSEIRFHLMIDSMARIDQTRMKAWTQSQPLSVSEQVYRIRQSYRVELKYFDSPGSPYDESGGSPLLTNCFDASSQNGTPNIATIVARTNLRWYLFLVRSNHSGSSNLNHVENRLKPN